MITIKIPIWNTDGAVQYEEAKSVVESLSRGGTALFGRGPRRLQSLTTTARYAERMRRASLLISLPSLPHRSRRSPSRCTRRTCRDFRSNKCYQHAAFAPPPNEPAEKRCQPRGGNCPEAMQPPHSSADRATSIHEPRFQLGASFTRTRKRPACPGSKEFQDENFGSLTVSICVFEHPRKRL